MQDAELPRWARPGEAERGNGSVEARGRRRVWTLRRIARWRKALGWALLASPTTVVLLFDAAHRGERLIELDWHHRATYGAAVLESLVVWGALLCAASRRSGWWRWVASALFVIGFTLSVGGQRYFFQQYNLYANLDVSWFATDFTESVLNQLLADLGNYLGVNAPPLLAALALLWLARRLLRPRQRPARVAGFLAPLLLVSSFFVPTQHRRFQASTPDVLYLNAAGGLIGAQLGLTGAGSGLSPRTRASLPVPPLVARPSRPRNVVLLIMESARADAVCVEPDPACRKTAYSNRLTLGRFPFTQMRALDSGTAISLAALWAGLAPHESRDVLHTWPLIFDYARAAGFNTAFWTSQNLLFGNSRLWVQNLGADIFCSGTQLDPTSDIDIGAPEHLLAERVVADLEQLKEPFLAVVQFSNVHFPYLTDPNRPQPFQPATTSKAPEDTLEFFNHYLNAIHQQDEHVASILRKLRSNEAGRRTVVLYTSDHGEAFREHGQAGHTFTVFDEEIRVPGWIDAPAGTLTAEERRNLAAKRDAFTFHIDFAPTILDLMGVFDDPGLERFKTKLLGTSLLRKETTKRPLPLSNCSGSWNCGFENWGYIREHMKLAARAGDQRYKCFNLLTDPRERHDLGPRACGQLEALAVATFRRLPGQK